MNKTAVTYSKTDIAEMIRDAKSVCKDAQIRPTEGNLRKVITDEHGEAVAAQVFAKPATAGKPKPTVADLQATVKTTEEKMKKSTKNAKPAAPKGVEANVENVASGKVKPTAKAKKSAKAKAAAPRKLSLVLGHSVISVARAFGKHGFMPADAVAAIHSVEPKASVAAIRTFVQAGRHGLRGTPAPVTKKQLKDLVPAVA